LLEVVRELFPEELFFRESTFYMRPGFFVYMGSRKI
jgi:hypothetical protein